MTQKDYIIIAGTLHPFIQKARLRNWEPDAIKLVEDFMIALGIDNDKFDRRKFYKAVGLTDKGEYPGTYIEPGEPGAWKPIGGKGAYTP